MVRDAWAALEHRARGLGGGPRSGERWLPSPGAVLRGPPALGPGRAAFQVGLWSWGGMRGCCWGSKPQASVPGPPALSHAPEARGRPRSLRLQVQPSPHGGVLDVARAHGSTFWSPCPSGSPGCPARCGARPCRTARDQALPRPPGSRLLACAVGTSTSRSGGQPLRTWGLFRPPMAVALGGALCEIPRPRRDPSVGRSDPGPRPPTPHSCQARLAAQACSTTVASGNVLSPGSTSRPLPPREVPGSTVTGPRVPAYLSFGRDCVSWCPCHPTGEGRQAVTATWLGGSTPADVLSGSKRGAGPLCRPDLIFRPWAD